MLLKILVPGGIPQPPLRRYRQREEAKNRGGHQAVTVTQPPTVMPQHDQPQRQPHPVVIPRNRGNQQHQRRIGERRKEEQIPVQQGFNNEIECGDGDSDQDQPNNINEAAGGIRGIVRRPQPGDNPLDGLVGI